MKKIKKQANIFSPVKHRYNLALREINTINPQILDVGGYILRNEIVSEYFSSFNYKSVNIGSAWYKDAHSDFLYDGKNLPFDDNFFDYLISVDTLEHISECDRFYIVEEMIRVAKKRIIIVFPFRIDRLPTDESYILYLCDLFNIEKPPSLVEHELLGLPLLSCIEKFTKKHFGQIKYATVKRDYWYIQTSMLWNTIALQGDSEFVNRKLQLFQENFLQNQSDPTTANEAYRCILLFEKN